MHALRLPDRHTWRMGLIAALAALAAFVAMTPPDLGGGSSGASFDARTLPGPVPPPAWIEDPLAPPTAQLAP